MATPLSVWQHVLCTWNLIALFPTGYLSLNFKRLNTDYFRTIMERERSETKLAKRGNVPHRVLPQPSVMNIIRANPRSLVEKLMEVFLNLTGVTRSLTWNFTSLRAAHTESEVAQCNQLITRLEKVPDLTCLNSS